MEDRFRFRFYDKNRQKIESYEHSLSSLGVILASRNPDKVPMQCTGLKDKNGKLIYEGDILKDPNWVRESEYAPSEPIFKIEYHNPSHRLMVYVTGMDEYDEIDQILNDFDKCPLEIIGNIYENKELLEVQNDNT